MSFILPVMNIIKVTSLKGWTKMIDFKPFYQKEDPDPVSCRTSNVGPVLDGSDRQMYYCLVDDIESTDVHYCEIQDYECRYVLPSAFESVGKDPEEEIPYSAHAETELTSFFPLETRAKGGQRQRGEQPQLTLDPPER
jgi:hypothetical protein